MKVFYSELDAQPAYYSFGYSVYGEIEEGDDLAACYRAGWLPFVGARLQPSPMLYMARGCRVRVPEFTEQHYHGRVVRKVEALSSAKVVVHTYPKETFPITDAFIGFLRSYFTFRFGKDSMPEERLRAILASPLLTHIVEYTLDGAPIAYMLEVHTSDGVHVWYQAYAKKFQNSHLGSYLFIDLLRRCKEAGKTYAYLGVTYGTWMKYKTNFQPLEYWDGAAWVQDPKSKQLKKLLATDALRVLGFVDAWRDQREPYYTAPYPFMSTFLELRFLTVLMTATPRLFFGLILFLVLLMGVVLFRVFL